MTPKLKKNQFQIFVNNSISTVETSIHYISFIPMYVDGIPNAQILVQQPNQSTVLNSLLIYCVTGVLQQLRV